MRVVMQKTACGPEGTKRDGETHDVPAQEAVALIKDAAARPAQGTEVEFARLMRGENAAFRVGSKQPAQSTSSRDASFDDAAEDDETEGDSEDDGDKINNDSIIDQDSGSDDESDDDGNGGSTHDIGDAVSDVEKQFSPAVLPEKFRSAHALAGKKPVSKGKKK